MRLLGHMVTRNERGRWLTSSLPWLAELCHGDVAVYDDQSEDDTLAYVAELGLHGDRRIDGMASFVENEGVFRWAAWQHMEHALSPRDGDWVLAVDADELLLSRDPTADADLVRMGTFDAIGEAVESGQSTITFTVAETFAFDGAGWPLIRTDRYWGSITAYRLARWQPGGVFDPRKEAGGSLPSAWPRCAGANERLQLLHLGYARAQDRVAKYTRYRQGRGHNPRHIQSIVETPHLTPWSGMHPPLQHDAS